MIVYLEATTEPSRWLWSAKAAEPEAMELRIVDGSFRPAVPVVRPGQRIRFQNLDPTFHELFALAEDDSFRVRIASDATSEGVALRRDGPVVVFCQLHPHESHLLLVSTARLHDLVDAEGRFEFPDVRPGHYRLGAVAAHGRSKVRELHIDARGVTGLRLVLEAH